MPDMKLFAGNATPELAQKVADRLFIQLGKAKVGRFSDGEISVEIEENVRGGDIFILQSTCAPTNDNLMELIVMVDAMRRASAGRITAVIPYFGYARQDRRVRSSRVPITAKVVADFLSSVGVDRVLTVDLHAEQIQGFFDVPADNVFGTPVLLEDMQEKNLENPVIVSPDIGGVVRARANAKLLDEATALKKNGAKRVFAYATHPVFSGNAVENLRNSCIDEIVVTDSIPLSPEVAALPNVRVLSLSPMLAESIRRVSNEESISAMFK
ncbi:ribose-phosphate pyrophosphokinase [Moritella viscosa]